jgi:hypothetical protein
MQPIPVLHVMTYYFCIFPIPVLLKSFESGRQLISWNLEKVVCLVPEAHTTISGRELAAGQARIVHALSCIPHFGNELHATPLVTPSTARARVAGTTFIHKRYRKFD